jgi:hypothetical protein
MHQQRQQQDAAALETARTQPIPGLTGSTTPGAGILPGQTTPQQQIPTPGVPSTLPPNIVMHAGRYGQQAQQLAGLLGGPMGNHMVPPPQPLPQLGAQPQPGAMYGTTMAPHHLAQLGAPAALLGAPAGAQLGNPAAQKAAMLNARRPNPGRWQGG